MPAPQPGKRRAWGDWAFYLVLALLVLAVFLFRGTGGAPTRVLGFSALRVLTDSMGDELPQGSLIITWAADPETLQIGDDITYLAGENVTVTHRIIGISENYMDTGQWAFTTQGVANPTPDGAKVPAANVVGKVIFHSLTLGRALHFIQQHWPWLLALVALGIAFIRTVGVIIRETKAEKGK